MGKTGCVSYMFSKKGVIIVDKDTIGEDELMDIALDAGAEDMLTEDDCYEIYTVPSDLGTVREALEAKGVQIVSADVDMIPDNEVTPTARRTGRRAKRFPQCDFAGRRRRRIITIPCGAAI